jgi:hypothetical protein
MTPTQAAASVQARRGLCAFVLALAASSAVACSRPSAAPRIELNTTTRTVDVAGLDAATLTALSRAQWSDAEWQALLRVSVKAASTGQDAAPPPVAGRYAVAGDVLRFTPLFPFDDGRRYDVALDGTRLPGAATAGWRGAATAVVGLPAVVRDPSTVVTHIYPSGDVLPANHLRMYVHFSAPMDGRSGHDYVVLLDDRGQEVVDAFLPLDADFWNDDRTRYTVFFDPGRVKRGILPNRQMGRALEAGRRYTLVIKREWRDGHGLPLKEEFRHEFAASPAIERALSMSDWRVTTPAAGTRDPVAVTFPDPLDHGLLRRALGIARDGPVDGEIAIESDETRWLFTPSVPWTAGDYDLVALAFLEDLAGNRIGRAFEVDNFERTDVSTEPERRTRRFSIGK